MPTPIVRCSSALPCAALPSALLVGALLVLGACKSTDSSESTSASSTETRTAQAQLTNEYVAEAEVVGVELPARIVTLRREDGSLFRTRASEDVRNLEQVKAGDKLRIRYKETLEATLRPEYERAGPAQGAYAAGRAEAGAKPAAGVGLAVSVRVKVVSIDRENDIVVCSLSSGELRSHRVVTAKGRDFLKKLRIGDVVQLDYAEALAVSVEKM